MAVQEVYSDDDKFVIEMAGTRWSVIYTFSIQKLASGASLARMMGEKVKTTLVANGVVVPKDEINAVAKEGVRSLRAVVEPYFATKGLAL